MLTHRRLDTEDAKKMAAAAKANPASLRTASPRPLRVEWLWSQLALRRLAKIMSRKSALESIK